MTIPLATVYGVGLICPRCKAWTAIRHAENLGKLHCMSCGHPMRAPEQAGKNASQFLAMAVPIAGGPGNHQSAWAEPE